VRQSALAPGSERLQPDSPHYADQTVLYARKQWVTERFTETQIRSDPYLHFLVLRG
jgi:acyl-homoserine-lactone acylase